MGMAGGVGRSERNELLLVFFHGRGRGSEEEVNQTPVRAKQGCFPHQAPALGREGRAHQPGRACLKIQPRQRGGAPPGSVK